MAFPKSMKNATYRYWYGGEGSRPPRPTIRGYNNFPSFPRSAMEEAEQEAFERDCREAAERDRQLRHWKSEKSIFCECGEKRCSRVFTYREIRSLMDLKEALEQISGPLKWLAKSLRWFRRRKLRELEFLRAQTEKQWRNFEEERPFHFNQRFSVFWTNETVGFLLKKVVAFKIKPSDDFVEKFVNNVRWLLSLDAKATRERIWKGYWLLTEYMWAHIYRDFLVYLGYEDMAEELTTRCQEVLRLIKKEEEKR